MNMIISRKNYEYKGNFFNNFYIQCDVYSKKGKERFILDSSEFLDVLCTMLCQKDKISLFKFPYLLYELFENTKVNVQGEMKEYELNLYRKHRTFTTKLETGKDYKKLYLEVLDYYAEKFNLQDVLNEE